MILDHSVYPDLTNPPLELHSTEDRADYVHRICGAFDFGIFPERTDWNLFRQWKDVFDLYPLPHSPGYHAFRSRYRWEPVEHGSHGLVPDWKAADMREGRIDPCEEMV